MRSDDIDIMPARTTRIESVISNLRYPTTFVTPRSKKEEEAKSGLSADSAIDACTRPTKQTYINVYILPSS